MNSSFRRDICPGTFFEVSNELKGSLHSEFIHNGIYERLLSILKVKLSMQGGDSLGRYWHRLPALKFCIRSE